MIRMWRLSEAGEHNLGLACTNDGLILGRTPLIERRDDRFVVRDRGEIEALLSRAYRKNIAADRLLPGLATVAAALNANDPCLARIAAVHLRIPDLPDRSARDGLEAQDILTKCAAVARDVHKASPDDPKHPGWPAGTPGGRGGKFRPKTDAEISQETKGRLLRTAARRALRMGVRAISRLGAEAVANLIPILDAAADAAMALDIVHIVSDYWKLATDTAAALEFAQKGPQNLEDLQVSNDYEEFADYDAFVKTELVTAIMEKRFGGAGAGFQYHHIVTQGGTNATTIPPEQLQNTDNIVRLPTLLHEEVNIEYLKPGPDTSAKNPDGSQMNMYQWLQTQPYEVQREEGLIILRRLQILK
jgi:hypothetical protein